MSAHKSEAKQCLEAREKAWQHLTLRVPLLIPLRMCPSERQADFGLKLSNFPQVGKIVSERSVAAPKHFFGGNAPSEFRGVPGEPASRCLFLTRSSGEFGGVVGIVAKQRFSVRKRKTQPRFRSFRLNRQLAFFFANSEGKHELNFRTKRAHNMEMAALNMR